MSSRLAPEELAAALEPIVRTRIPGAENATIVNWAKTERGFATETYLFDLDAVDESVSGGRQFVFRRPPEVSLFPDYDLLRQYLVMRRLEPTGVPVPHVRWIDTDGADLGSPYFVMDRIVGGDAPSDVPSYHTAGNYFDADETGRSRMWWGCVDTIAQVHGLDTANLGFLAYPQHGTGPIEQVVGYLDGAVRWATRKVPPELERALAWLRANSYEPEHTTLCWGDSRLSNILYTPDQDIVGVLDWEIAYIGDHEADLAWLLFLDWASSEYEGNPRLPGTPTRAETISRYEELTGWPVRNLRFNEVLAAVLLSVPLLRMSTHLELDGHIDITAFCKHRITMLLDGDQLR